MSDGKQNEETEAPEGSPTGDAEKSKSGPAFGEDTGSGPGFESSPDPLAGVKKAGNEAWQATEGKTVSMRVYIGTIAAVIILMLLARCGG